MEFQHSLWTEVVIAEYLIFVLTLTFPTDLYSQINYTLSMTQTYVITGHADETTTVLAVYSDKNAAEAEYKRLEKLMQESIDGRGYFPFMDGVGIEAFDLNEPYTGAKKRYKQVWP